MKNSFGNQLTLTLFGESHGEYIGAVIDGLTPGVAIDHESIKNALQKRRPRGKMATARVEADEYKIISGEHNGKATGTPLTIIIPNQNTKSGDYSALENTPRPSHADYTAELKYHGYQDKRGGGHFSGRLTLPVVAAGVVAKKMLADLTLLDDTPVREVRARIVELGGVGWRDLSTSLEMTEEDLEVTEEMPVKWLKAIERTMAEGDSLGAVVECTVPEIDPGYGEPFWDSVEAKIAHAIFSIPGVRGIEFGDGFQAARMKGSEHNDPIGPDGRPTKNGAGGVNGGITNGAPLKFRVAFKPTSSISKAQQTFNFATGEMDTLEVKGRHDACFALRTPVVVEAMTAIVLADLVLVK